MAAGFATILAALTLLALRQRQFELIVFDLDGVLVDTSDKHACAFGELWDRVGLPGPPYATIAGQRTREVVSRVCEPLKLASEEIAELVAFKQARARELIASGSVTFADTLPTLNRMSPYARFAIGTGASRDGVEAVLPQLGGAERFETVVAAEDVRCGKPAPEVYETVLSRCGVDRDRALIVEDSESGVRSALAAGSFAVLVRSLVVSEAPRCLGSYPDLATLADALEVPR